MRLPAEKPVITEICQLTQFSRPGMRRDKPRFGSPVAIPNIGGNLELQTKEKLTIEIAHKLRAAFSVQNTFCEIA